MEFYTDAIGRLRLRSCAGADGGGITGYFDGLATAADIAANPGPYAIYLANPVNAVAEAAEPTDTQLLAIQAAITPIT